MTQRRSRRFSTGGLYSRGAVRTRGFIPGPPSEAEGAPVRARGAVRIRGPAVKVEPWQELKPKELGELLEELRDNQERFPITIVVENPQAPEVQAFLECLKDLLEADDVLWVLGEGKYEDAVPEALREFTPENAYLNIQEGEQKTLADTLVPDLVFVADVGAKELEKRLEKWERRVLVVVIGAPADFNPGDLSGLKLGIEAKSDWLRRWPVKEEGAHA